MAERAREERPVEARAEPAVVRVLDREPVQLEPEEVEPEQRGEERGERAKHHESGNDHAVDEAAAPPGGDHADGGADDEREQEGDADQEDRVRQRPADHLGHGRRVVRRRDAEVEVRDPAEVRDVVLPDRVVATAEQRLVGLMIPGLAESCDGLRCCEQPADRAAGHQPREQEVDRQRDPDREDVEDEPTGEPAHIGSSEGKRRAVRRRAARRSVDSGTAQGPLLPPGQIRVNERMLSGKVVKIGSP